MWSVQRTAGPWRMTLGYCKPSPVVAPTAAAVPYVVSLLESINTCPSNSYAAIDLANKCLFLCVCHKAHQRQFAFSWQSQQYIFTVLPQGYISSPALCHSLVRRDLNHLFLPQDSMLVHFIGDTVLIGFLGKTFACQRVENTLDRVSGAFQFSEIPRSTEVWGVWRCPSQGKG